ncbi:four-helix bundle copper-binding protein [Flavihumibacter petaseus]|uniref:four-helix bundle copper-binding protein n=1 Tax=Flavihumibacter petaseus TaxID=549295 RepID=UPI00061CE930|nr:four-helix bundle copper-binding protein [Flavihumibacter petaseus]
MTTHSHTGLLKALNNCAAACHFCAVSCLDEPAVANLVACIKTDLDCAAICLAAHGFVSRISPHAPHVLRECAEICALCAAECEKHAAHMDHCRLCAEACRACEEACRQAA